MPIFHFDIADGVRLEDPVGLDCASEHDARRTANRIARQIAIDLVGDNESRSVVVVDEAGSEIYEAPVRARGLVAASPARRKRLNQSGSPRSK